MPYKKLFFEWLKASLTPPYLEHFSFRLRNQLFFVRVEDVDGELDCPGTLEGLFTIADACQGHACIIRMKKQNGTWQALDPGSGLTCAITGNPIDPIQLATRENIEMTDWELQDFAVKVVGRVLEGQGHKIMSWQADPEVSPSLWFVGPEGPEWVIIRAIRYPAQEAELPKDWQATATNCAQVSPRGHFASVAVANADDSFDQAQPAIPLWRGRGMYTRFTGLQLLQTGLG